MKKTLLSSAMLIISFSSFAQTQPQTTGDASSDRIIFGVKAGYVLSNFTRITERQSSFGTAEIASSSFNNGFYIGGTVTKPLGYGFSVQSGLSLVRKGATLTQDAYYTTTKGKLVTKYTPLYLEIPINLIGNSPFGNLNFYYGVGPFIAFGIAGGLDRTISGFSEAEKDVIYSATGFKTEDRSIKYGSDKDMRGIDFGANILLGAQWKKVGFDASYSYNFANALADQTNGGDMKAYNGIVTFGLSYSF